MSNEELKQLGQTLIAISEGAKWQVKYPSGDFIDPSDISIRMHIAEGAEIRLKPRTITVSGIEMPRTR